MQLSIYLSVHLSIKELDDKFFARPQTGIHFKGRSNMRMGEMVPGNQKNKDDNIYY